jgi:hypothetical protein
MNEKTGVWFVCLLLAGASVFLLFVAKERFWLRRGCRDLSGVSLALLHLGSCTGFL